MTTLYILFACLAGLCVGSFLNVAIYRLPLMMQKETLGFKKFNLFLPRSHCPHCTAQVPWYHNIPIMSYVVLQGKSRCCSKPISPRYPLVELITGLLTLYTMVHFDFTTNAVAALIFVWSLIALIFIDFETMLLPDMITIPTLWLGIYVNVFNVFTNLQSAVIGAIAGYCIFWAVGFLFKTLRGVAGLGFGDYKLLAMLGAWLGWQHLPMIILLSSLSGVIFGGSLMLLQGRKYNQPIPFGPFLCISGLLALYYGDTLTHWYLSMIGIY